MTTTLTRPALRPYQAEAIERTLEAEQRGVRRLLGVAATGLGKAQPVDEPVLTPSGWVPIGGLRIGDLVVGSDGHPTPVVGVFPQGRRPIVEATFSDGARVRCDRDHLWSVRDKYDAYHRRPWRVMSTAEIAAHPRRWRVPLMSAAQFYARPAPLPLDPYLLGVLLGDGGFTRPTAVMLHTEHALAATLALPTPCTLTKQREDGPNGIGGTYIIGGPVGRGANPVMSALRELGLMGKRSTEKRIPDAYALANVPARLDLLRGIMDADGHVRQSDNHVEITLANEGLIDDVAALVRSLGGTARKSTKSTTWTHRGERRHGTAWRLSIALDANPFRWKAGRWRPREKYPPTRRFHSVADVGSAECVCIAVAAPDQLYVTRDFVVTHNTCIFAALAERRGGRALILAHRDELVGQAVEKLVDWWPGVDVGIVKAGEDSVHAHVVVASVQTLSRRRRLDRLVDSYSGALMGGGQFGLVVVDEAHHSAADSYRRVLEGLRAGEQDGPLLLGVTATPDRGDGKGLDDLFDEVAWSYDLLWGIEHDYLCDVRGLRVVLDSLDLGRVKVSRGDYDAGSAGLAMHDAGAPAVLVKAWKEHASDRRTLVFVPTVALAGEVAAAFVRSGVRASWVSGETPLDERRATLRAYSNGEVQVLVNCAVLTEGYDEPRTDCVVMARPTKSRALYTQCVGRGTRKHPEKADLLVLDLVGATAQHSLVTVPSLFGVEGKQALALQTGAMTVTDAIAEREQELRSQGMRVEEAEMFKRVRSKGMSWIRLDEAGAPLYMRTMGYKSEEGGWVNLPTVYLGQTSEGEHGWSCWATPNDGPARTLISGVTLEMAQGVGEDLVRKAMGSRAVFVDAGARWRQKPPSPRAVAAAQKWRLPDVGSYTTAGALSDALDAHIQRVKAKRK